MIYSMTAFARVQNQSKSGNLVCEMRSINHRYLEISVYLPEALRVLEMPIRECIKKYVKRGKIECSIRQQTSNSEVNAFKINDVLAEELCNLSEHIATFLKNPAATYPTDILRFPGVLETHELIVSEVEKEILNLVEKTVRDLMSTRSREGEELKELFFQRLELMKDELIKVRERLPNILQEQKDRLLKRFTEAKLEVDPNRLEQELVMFAQKMDVAEEIDRIETHIAEIRRRLKEGGPVGRRLDFLLQELNREANTLGSKSTDSVTTHAAVEVKVLIEQIREQVQNIE